MDTQQVSLFSDSLLVQPSMECEAEPSTGTLHEAGDPGTRNTVYSVVWAVTKIPGNTVVQPGRQLTVCCLGTLV